MLYTKQTFEQEFGMKDSTQPHLFNVCYVNIYDDCGVHCETEFCESDPGKKSI